MSQVFLDSEVFPSLSPYPVRSVVSNVLVDVRKKLWHEVVASLSTLFGG